MAEFKTPDRVDNLLSGATQAEEAHIATDAPVAASEGARETQRKMPSVHKEVVTFLNRSILFHILLLDGSFFLWIGNAGLGLDDLQAAVPTQYDALPLVTTLRGEMDGPGSSLAQKLSRRFNRLVFLSYCLSGSEPELMLFLQKETTRILRELLGDTT